MPALLYFVLENMYQPECNYLVVQGEFQEWWICVHTHTYMHHTYDMRHVIIHTDADTETDTYIHTHDHIDI